MIKIFKLKLEAEPEVVNGTGEASVSHDALDQVDVNALVAPARQPGPPREVLRLDNKPPLVDMTEEQWLSDV